jgi:hypothetical protein
MKRAHTWLWLFALVAVAIASPAQPTNNNASAKQSAEQIEETYRQAIEKRTAGILAVLALEDAAKTDRLHDLIIAHYRALRDWHDSNDAKLKEGSDEEKKAIKSSLQTVHDKFLTALGSDLSPEQVDKVKECMTYNKVRVTYDAYCEIVPNLTAEEKDKMLQWLKQAREEAMDAGSSQEKDAVFNKYKGRINNFLSANGHDLKKAYKDWGEKQKSKKGALE